MTHPLRTCVATVAALAVAAPVALAHGGDPAGASGASSRVKHSVKRTLRVLDRAVDAIDDGDDTAAVAKLGAVDKNLARALKAANRRAAEDNGPASLGAVATAADEVATTTAEALDGASQDLSDALVSSLDGALDDRDAIVTVLDDSRALNRIAADSGDEADAFQEGVEDDELVASAETALGDAATQATATQTAAADKAGTAADDDTGQGALPGNGDCPHGGGGGHGGPHGPQGGPTGPTGPTGASGSQGAPSRRT